MRIMTWGALAAALLAACATEKRSEAGGEASRDSAAPAAGAPSAAGGDADVAAGGRGLPAGYTGRTDKPAAKLADAKYAAAGGAWEITTGPAHIIYAPRDTASGVYTVTATIDQLEAPRHPEAYGVFVGGRNLEGAGQQYTYFLVRGGGEYLVKVRTGDSTRTVIDWKPSDAVPKQDASGKASYRLAVRVGGDSVRFLVNDRQVAAAPNAALPTDGVAGLRINHNLHVRARPVEIKRG
jgi:hypothetical protein